MRPSSLRLRGGFWKNEGDGKAKLDAEARAKAKADYKTSVLKRSNMDLGVRATSQPRDPPPKSAPKTAAAPSKPAVQTNSPVAQGLTMLTCIFAVMFPLARGGFNADNTQIVLWVVACIGSLIFSLFFLGAGAIGWDLLASQRANTIQCLGINLLVQLIVLAHAGLNMPAAFPFKRRLEDLATRNHALIGGASMLVLMLAENDRPSDLTAADEGIVSKITTFLSTAGVWWGYWFAATRPLLDANRNEGKDLQEMIKTMPAHLAISALYTLMGLYNYISLPLSKIAPCTVSSDFGPRDQ